MEGSDDIEVREIMDVNTINNWQRGDAIPYDAELQKMIGSSFTSDGFAYIGLFKGDKIIGGVLLSKDHLPWEYRFDVVISRSYRGKGYLKLLINKLIADFKADPVADQLSAQVVNKKLVGILERYGFSIGNFEDLPFAWMTK